MQNDLTGRPLRRAGLFGLATLTLGAAIGVGGTAIAGSSGADHTRGQARVLVSGQSSGGSCKLGYQTLTTDLTPPDDSTLDNPPAASIQMKKKCAGAVVATFTAETNVQSAGDFIHVDVRAKCNGSGGLSGPTCAPGQTILGSPGHTFLATGPVPVTSTHSMSMLFRGLKPGSWTFQVLPGGNNSASLGFRTFTVEGYTGG